MHVDDAVAIDELGWIVYTRQFSPGQIYYPVTSKQYTIPLFTVDVGLSEIPFSAGKPTPMTRTLLPAGSLTPT